MREKAVAFAAISVLVLVWGRVEAADKAQIDAKIKEAASYLDEPGPGPDAKTMFKRLMETISLAAPETTFPREFAEHVVKAKDIFESTSIFNPEGLAYLHKSYRLINSGEDFEMPTSISEISDAVEYAKMQLAAARKDLHAGKTDECVRKLIEVAVMTVTPKPR